MLFTGVTEQKNRLKRNYFAPFRVAFSNALPATPIGLYYTYYGGTPAIDSYSQDFNVIKLFHATNSGGGRSTDGNIVWNQHLSFSQAQTNAQIATCRGRGQLVQLTVGGAGAQIDINSQTNADNFVASVKSINQTLGGTDSNPVLDGLDLNHYEGDAFTQAHADWLIYAITELKRTFGNQFFVSSPVAGFGGGQADDDRLLMANLYANKCIDWIHPQFYDPSDLNTEDNVRLYLDHYSTSVSTAYGTVQIPRNIIGVGFAIAEDNVGTTSRWNTVDAANAYNRMQFEGKTPRGAMLFGTYDNGTLITMTNFENDTIAAVKNNTATYTPSDDLQSRVAVELGRLRTSFPNADLWLGECGIPNDAGGDQADWNELMNLVARKCAADNISFTYWATGHEWDDSYNLSPEESPGGNPNGTWNGTPIATSVREALDYLNGHAQFVGWCYAGMEFGTGEADSTAAPSVSDFTYHRDIIKATPIFRYALGEPSWTTEWLWDDVNHSLRSDDLAHVEFVMNRAQAAGVKIILDVLHPGSGSKYATILQNGTRYTLNDANGIAEYKLYIDALLTHTFNDNNSNSTRMVDHPALYAVDIANEPNGVTWQQWETRSQEIVNHIRDNAQAIDSDVLLMVALGGFSGIQDLTFRHTSGDWITDPANNYVITGHLYLESSHIGNYTDTSLTLSTALTTDNVTSVEVSSIDANTPQDGYLYVRDNNGDKRKLHHTSWTGTTYTIDNTDGAEDFAAVNASAGNQVEKPIPYQTEVSAASSFSGQGSFTYPL